MKDDTIQLTHGSGGKKSLDLIRRVFLPSFSNPWLARMDDQAVLDSPKGRLAFTTDSYVVDPLFFPGGNIGDLAINGTVNDLCMCGARPLYLTAGFIIEEGFSIRDLEKIVLSMKEAAERAGVFIVSGDTKVVNKGKGDKVFINTSGIGVLEHDFDISCGNLRVGDKVLLSGSLGDHGMAILSKREGLSFETSLESDTAPLNGLVEVMMKTAGKSIHAMRDPTRGGVAATLNEFASASGVGICIREEDIPVKPQVLGACEIIGLDPLYVANEGKLVAVAEPEAAGQILRAMRDHPLGREAEIIGEVVDSRPGQVIMETRVGGRRVVDMPMGEQLPRIC